MKQKRIINYKSVNSHFKHAIMLKYYSEDRQCLTTITLKRKTIKIMKLHYQDQNFLIILDRNTLALLKMDYRREMKLMLENDSFNCIDLRQILINNLIYT